MSLDQALTSDSFLEYAFLRWVLTPAVNDSIQEWVIPQQSVTVLGRTYRVDYAIRGRALNIAIELDGFAFHVDRNAFSYDRLRQNDLHAAGWLVIRFSYDSIRLDTARCVAQLQSILRRDPLLTTFLIENPVIEQPDMEPNPLFSVSPLPSSPSERNNSYFDSIRNKLNLKTLRDCQNEALAALDEYFRDGNRRAACVMSVGAGKTALGVATCLAFAQCRAMVITPGSVIRGTFDKAFDHQALGNVLYGLRGGPLIPGCKPPHVLTLDREDGPIRLIQSEDLLKADVIITNFHSLGNGEDEDDLLFKLESSDIDFIVVDEAHIAASESYQRAFQHFPNARSLLMSACFQRLDGKPIDADVVYRYRLIDSIADGHAKNLRVRRFAPEVEQTTYEMLWSNGSREEITGREALLELVKDERKLARITAKSDASIRQLMRIVRAALDEQSALLYPVKPRVLFSALGERHAEQIAKIANDYGIACDYLHYSMTESRLRSIRDRFEQDSGDLQGIVQLKMLGQGYDFPPITIVVPMRPYGSFSEFYQFIGRGIRVLQHPALLGRVDPEQQFLDIIYHAEFELDSHIETIYQENDMDPLTVRELPTDWQLRSSEEEFSGTRGNDVAARPDTFVLFEQGEVDRRIVHDEERIGQRKAERQEEALAQRYATYAQANPNPVSFEQFKQIMRLLHES
ncbi:MAG: DEAD/DEAH box helicase family protein [Leptolyngbya sp. UWPOB_LEPTO1]|uniref:DEAD/DEAH box helicase family protein n=1 Tax=Leptolyngbya sp. UWPOB_LEPTO1 TaxID=2815653 RepID=UPI001AC43015|nr:DEAD/DEAH box helicase family protein [Leptolyngbya sp. UWPOB_LEPTO1]MBN8564798.1 DEAD/DEAH box helicase family protein [Leptolyngbya sp. UWPOB_LEPTO1]